MAGIILIMSSCATIFSSSKYKLSVGSNPSDAKFKVTNREGKKVYEGKTPKEIELKANSSFFIKQSYKINFPDHKKSFNVECEIDPWYWVNLVLGSGGILGFFIIDPLTGAMYKLKTNSIEANLPNINRDVIYLEDGSIIKGKIIERSPNKSIKIKTSNGNVFNYEIDQIKKIKRKE